MRQRRQRSQQIVPVPHHLDCQRTLPGCRQHLVRIKSHPDALFQSQALEPSGSQDNAVKSAFIELAQASIQIATQRLNADIGSAKLRKSVAQKHHPTQARSTHHSAWRQVGQAGAGVGHQSVARVLTLHHAGQHEASRQLHRDVFERMHG